MAINKPRVSIIIPTRNGEITRLQESLDAQTFQDFERIVVIGVSPGGHARNQGVRQASADLFLFIDDDAYCGAPDMLERLVEVADQHPEFAIVGTAKILPPDATSLQRRIARDVPRWVFPVSDTLLESNPPTSHYGFSALSTTCILIRRSWFEQADGFDESLPNGPEDTEFFYRLRKLGARFAVAPHTWVCHPPPGSLGALLRKSFAYGVGHAFEAWQSPSRGMQIVPLDRWYSKVLVLLSIFLFPVSLFVTYYFDPARIMRIGWHPIKALSSYATLYGYTYGWYFYIRPKRKQPTLPLPTAAAGDRPSASRSSIVTILAFLSVAALNYAYANIMAWLLPIHAYGVLGLAQSCVLIAATLLNSGFPWGLARALADETLQATAYQAAKSALAGTLAIALGFCLLLVIGEAAGLQLDAGAPVILSLLIVETFLLAIAGLWSGVLQGIMRFGALGLGRFIEVFAKVVIGIALVLLGFGAEGAIAGIVVGTGLSLVILGWSSRHFSFWHERSWGTWQSYRASLIIFVGLSALTIIANFDIIGLKLFSLSSEADRLTGHYQAAVVLTRIPILLASAYAATLFPYISAARGMEISIYIRAAIKYTSLLIIPVNLIFIAIPEAVMGLIFPEAYLTSAPVLRIAALGSTLLALASVITTTFQARGQAHIPARSLPVAVIVEIAALWLLVPTYAAIGAALALLLSSLVASGSLLVSFMRHYSWHIRLTHVLQYLLASVTMVVLLMLLPHSSASSALISMVVGLLIYVLLLALLRLLRPSDLTVLTAGLPLDRVASAAALYKRCSGIIDRLNRVFPLPDSA